MPIIRSRDKKEGQILYIFFNMRFLPALMLTMMVFLAVHDSSETKIYALNLSLLKTKEVVDILFIQIRTILLKLLYRAMLSINTSIIKGYLIFYVSLIFST